MKILFLDWAGWVYKKPHHLKDFLLSKGVLCYDREVAPFQFGTLQEPKTHIPKDMKAKDNHRGFDLMSMIQRAVVKDDKWYHYRKETIERRSKEAEIFIDWAFGTYEELQPDYIVVEGGLTHFSRPFVEVARELGIGVIALENTFIKDKIIIDFDTGAVCNRHLFARTAKDWMRTRVLTPKKEVMVDALIGYTFATQLRYPTQGEWKYDKPYIFVPLQVYNDQVTVFDTSYDNEDFIKAIMSVAKQHPEFDFILKCHPKEERVPTNRETGNWLAKQNLPSNIRVIRDGFYDTQVMIYQSQGVIVNNTQAGLEAALLGKKVYVLGDAFYRFHGTYDFKNFDSTIKHQYDESYQKDAKLFFYYFYLWLYDHNLTKTDKHRISRRLHI